jgi:hypothetical protein
MSRRPARAESAAPPTRRGTVLYAAATIALLGLMWLVIAILVDDGGSQPASAVLSEPALGPSTVANHSPASDMHAGKDTVGLEDAPAFVANLGVLNQVSDGRTITVADAEVGGSPGWVVVQGDKAGKPGAVIGMTRRLNGEHGNAFAVHLTKPISTGAYWVTLHRDLGRQRVFEFPGPARSCAGRWQSRCGSAIRTLSGCLWHRSKRRGTARWPVRATAPTRGRGPDAGAAEGPRK